jgi:hypothetical protein
MMKKRGMMMYLYNSLEVASMLGVTRRTAQIRIKKWNEALVALGYHIEVGKVPKAYFHKKNPFIKEVLVCEK